MQSRVCILSSHVTETCEEVGSIVGEEEVSSQNAEKNTIFLEHPLKPLKLSPLLIHNIP